MNKISPIFDEMISDGYVIEEINVGDAEQKYPNPIRWSKFKNLMIEGDMLFEMKLPIYDVLRNIFIVRKNEIIASLDIVKEGEFKWLKND